MIHKLASIATCVSCLLTGAVAQAHVVAPAANNTTDAIGQNRIAGTGMVWVSPPGPKLTSSDELPEPTSTCIVPPAVTVDGPRIAWPPCITCFGW